MTGIIKKRNPLTNNTHTSGMIDKARPHMISGGGTSYNNFVKSGVQTPNGVKILERSMKANNNSLHGSIEESKHSERKYLHIPNTNLNIMQSNSQNTSMNKQYGANNLSINTKQLISPHSIASKYQSLSTKNEEIKGKVKMFENLFPAAPQQL
jgi:hypothetical protein